MLTVRTPDRSTPRTHEATSAMSAVCTSTSKVAGSEIEGGFTPATRSTARRAPSVIMAWAISGCRFDAPNRVKDSLTTTRSASARNGLASPAVWRSPVISPTGTR